MGIKIPRPVLPARWWWRDILNSKGRRRKAVHRSDAAGVLHLHRFRFLRAASSWCCLRRTDLTTIKFFPTIYSIILQSNLRPFLEAQKWNKILTVPDVNKTCTHSYPPSGIRESENSPVPFAVLVRPCTLVLVRCVMHGVMHGVDQHHAWC